MSVQVCAGSQGDAHVSERLLRTGLTPLNHTMKSRRYVEAGINAGRKEAVDGSLQAIFNAIRGASQGLDVAAHATLQAVSRNLPLFSLDVGIHCDEILDDEM